MQMVPLAIHLDELSLELLTDAVEHRSQLLVGI
jgi:hypothetical protein